MPVRSGRRPRRAPKVQLPRPREGRRLTPGIVRLDYERAKGYVVRLHYLRTEDGWRPKFHQYFGDAKYKSKAKALAAAEAWLETVSRTGKAPRGSE